MSDCASIFPGRRVAKPDELRFRSVCALGWAIDQNFPEFWDISGEQRPPWDLAGWIARLESDVLQQLHAGAKNCNEIPRRLGTLLEDLSEDFDVSERLGASPFLKKLASQVAKPDALDTIAQIQALHERGFHLASHMILDNEWSPKAAAKVWGPERRLNVRSVEDKEKNLVLETVDGEILLKVCDRFELPNSLLEYSTLEFKFMHEYISHVLPVWRSAGGRLEEVFLMVAAQRYYSSLDRQLHRPELVYVSEEKSPDYWRAERKRFDDTHTIFVLPPRLAQIFFELAVTNESVLDKARKDEFLARLVKAKTPFSFEYRKQLQTASLSDLCDWISPLGRGA